MAQPCHIFGSLTRGLQQGAGELVAGRYGVAVK